MYSENGPPKDMHSLLPTFHPFTKMTSTQETPEAEYQRLQTTGIKEHQTRGRSIDELRPLMSGETINEMYETWDLVNQNEAEELGRYLAKQRSCETLSSLALCLLAHFAGDFTYPRSPNYGKPEERLRYLKIIDARGKQRARDQ
jgi:hypothetical protein